MKSRPLLLAAIGLALLVGFPFVVDNPYYIHLAQTIAIYAILLLNGTIRAFNAPAAQSFGPLIVDKEHYPNAVAWGSSSFQAAVIIGPSIGGLLYGLTGSPIPVYACAAIGYLSAFALLSRISLAASGQPRPAATWGMALEGLKFIWRSKLNNEALLTGTACSE